MPDVQAYKTALDAVAGVLTKHRVVWWLAHGTLLGAAREKTFLLREHDDIDVQFRNDEVDWKALTDDFRKAGCTIRALCNAGGLSGGFNLTHSDVLIDVGYPTFHGKVAIDTYLAPNWMSIKTLPKHLFHTLTTVELAGGSYPAPHPVEEYLTLYYGKDWRTPRDHWDYRTDHPCIKSVRPCVYVRFYCKSCGIPNDWFLIKHAPLHCLYCGRAADVYEALETREERIRELSQALETREERIRELSQALETREERIRELSQALETREERIRELSQALETREEQLSAFRESVGIQLVQRYWVLVERALPCGTRRRKYYELALAAAKILLRQGLRSLLRHAKQRYVRAKRATQLRGCNAHLQPHQAPADSAGCAKPATGAVGLDVIGYAAGEFGIGAHARVVALAAQAVGLPYTVDNLVAPGHRNLDPSIKAFTSDHRYPINVVCVNPDQLSWLHQTKGTEFYRGKYNVGYWTWELATFPEEWQDSFANYQEIWVPSTFALASIAGSAPIPVSRVYCVHIDESRLNPSRARFDLPEDAYIFVFNFDFHSFLARKNPTAVVSAFKMAFDDRNDVLLLLKSINGQHHPRELQHLREAIGQAPNIRHIETHMWRHDLLSLIACCDCYVSLHRSEGFGLTIAEAMYLGKPVIATGYSGNMDFMTVNNSLPVRYRLVEVRPDEYPPHRPGFVWADPDVAHAAELMHFVCEDRDVAKQLGERAAADIKRLLSPQAAGQELQRRVASIAEKLALGVLWDATHALQPGTSETAKCRRRLSRYCLGNGVDLGYGGDPIVPSAITVDLPTPYNKVGDHPLNLAGDARNLYWFSDNSLDYVYSSHLLEDFEDTEGTLREWLRVLKPGGVLVLFCPDEQAYRSHCKKHGQTYNLNHKHPDFSLAYVEDILLNRIGNVEVIHENPLVDAYSFELVVRKMCA
jgi:glycosyltransferase involved in cell wall biosynthesis/predicted SAM-dependent methyltransferase